MAVVPAAGHATRLGPQPASKEVLPVRGKPVMDHLLGRLAAAAPDEIRVVTRPDKLDVTAHARAAGARVIHGRPHDVAASLKLGMNGLADDDEVLVGYPDTLWEPEDGFPRLLGALREGADVALGLFRTSEAKRSDVVVLADGRVQRILVKPERPPSDLIWGIAAARTAALRGLQAGMELGQYFDSLANRGRYVGGVWMSSEWLDIGTREALRRAGR